jgi:hypothetical protein
MGGQLRQSTMGDGGKLRQLFCRRLPLATSPATAARIVARRAQGDGVLLKTQAFDFKKATETSSGSTFS